ncbi:hypothetical protein K2Z83_10040 [Oscillochloris sp. ZM17-4]|nr:hypothetical protein [Oscillochloris sp. ZM17-4]MBX0328015.1 hypothetical protein [Oscillochloris sp. ZM17-4]
MRSASRSAWPPASPATCATCWAGCATPSPASWWGSRPPWPPSAATTRPPGCGGLGHRDAEGYLYVADRRSDLIISGGENIYPAEVEAALLSHPAVAEAGVVGLPDERWGQAPVAAVVLRGPADPDEILAFVRGRLAAYKLPRRIVILADLPRTASGKLQRRLLRERVG